MIEGVRLIMAVPFPCAWVRWPLLLHGELRPWSRAPHPSLPLR